MAIYFLDSSALVKRYAPEVGSSWVMDLVDPRVRNTIVISQAALVEVVAALCAKAAGRTTSTPITLLDRDRAIALFRRDANGSYARQRVTNEIYRRGGNLCRQHDGLRAYDAVQLACALALRDQLTFFGTAPVFVCADNRLLSIASLESLANDNPNLHP